MATQALPAVVVPPSLRSGAFRVPVSRSLAGKVALITGASRGIGRAIALELASRGAIIAINCHTNNHEAESVQEEIEYAGGSSKIFRGDISGKLEAGRIVDEILQNYGRIAILINNAGITRDRSIVKMSDNDWHDVINTNLSGAFYCTKAVIPAMMKEMYGRIISVASLSAQAGLYGQANYAASKGGLIALTKVLALELAKYNITANVISPGFTDTDMMAGIPPERLAQIKEKIPMHRLAQPEDIGKAAAYLICDADYVTGQQINVNGGLYM